MKRALLLTSACLLDALAGDPEWFPHPVRIIGLAIAKSEARLRSPDRSWRFDLFAGAALTSFIVGGTYFLTRAVLRSAKRLSPPLGEALGVTLAWTCLATRNLHDEASTVLDALEANQLPRARLRLARIVGRDTAALDVSEISRAVIETVAESASDAVIAPLFYMALGGVPLAMAYKAINTLDSMIGHADAEYLYFGKSAARFDDAANFLPARCTALAIASCAAVLAECDAASAFKIWARDGGKHRSPNAGQPESAMAGALRIRLGGENTYSGVAMKTPRMGAEFPSANVARGRASLRILLAVAVVGWTVAALSSVATRRRTR